MDYLRLCNGVKSYRVVKFRFPISPIPGERYKEQIDRLTTNTNNYRIMDCTVVNIVQGIVNTNKRNDGWTELACLGVALSNKGVNIKDYGYTKLKSFFDSMPDTFTITTDSKTSLPLVKCASSDFATETTTVPCVDHGRVQKPIQLTKWACINQREAIDALKEISLKECWSYKTKDENYPSPILAKYLKWTFVKILRENKILYANKYAAFNTGLVDKFYKPIYALFEKNRIPMQPWYFKSFCVAGSSCVASRILTDNFSVLPQRATYITNYDDIIFDCSLPIDVNWDHIILENIDRLPNDFLRQVCLGLIEIRDNESIKNESGKHYYEELKSVLHNNPNRLAMLSNLLNAAVEVAKLRVEWNYKTAIPIYYPTDDKIHLILPLALDYNEPDKISLALVMTKTPSKRYRAVTILTLDMAYTNARLVTKPSSDWLNAEAIHTANNE